MNKNTLKNILLTAGLVALLGSEVTFGNSDPNTNDFSFGFPGVDLNSLSGAKSGVGLDGKIRILWDIYSGVPVLNQSQLWLLNANGSIASQFILPVGSGPVQANGVKSNILFQGQADGNTTLLFLFSVGNGIPVNSGSNPVNAFSVVTINASGQAIAGATFGPYAGTVVASIHFVGPDIAVLWASRNTTTASSTYTGWGLNEFGSLIASAGPFAYANTFAKVDVLPTSNQEVWLWDSQIGNTQITGGRFPSNIPADGQNVLGVWIINSNGSFVVAQSYGPF